MARYLTGTPPPPLPRDRAHKDSPNSAKAMTVRSFGPVYQTGQSAVEVIADSAPQ